MTAVLGPPRLLRKEDDRSDFASGAEELDEWFRRYAWQNQRAHNATTYVLAHHGVILGYHAIAAAAVSREVAPTDFARGRPGVIPCVLLARLAVDSRAQGRRLGQVLFRDSIERAVHVSGSIGAAALLIHARDNTAREFYLANADLLESPTDPLHLMLPIAEAKKWL